MSFAHRHSLGIGITGLIVLAIAAASLCDGGCFEPLLLGCAGGWLIIFARNNF